MPAGPPLGAVVRCPARAHVVPARITTKVGIIRTMPMVRVRGVPAVEGPKVGMAAIPAATDRAVAAMPAVGPAVEMVAVATAAVATAAEILGAEDNLMREAGCLFLAGERSRQRSMGMRAHGGYPASILGHHSRLHRPMVGQ